MKPNELDPALHGARRARLAQAMQGGVAVIPTAPERIRNRDTHFPYRFDSHFYYLTGFPEPEAVLVIVAGVTAGSKAQLAPLWRAAADRGEVTGELYEGHWSDVGTPERLSALEARLKKT